MHVTLNAAMLEGIARELNDVGHKRYDDVHVQATTEPEGSGFWAASEIIVTADAGYGTYSFYVNENGETRQAGMGEAVAA